MEPKVRPDFMLAFNLEDEESSFQLDGWVRFLKELGVPTAAVLTALDDSLDTTFAASPSAKLFRIPDPEEAKTKVSELVAARSYNAILVLNAEIPDVFIFISKVPGLPLSGKHAEKKLYARVRAYLPKNMPS